MTGAVRYLDLQPGGQHTSNPATNSDILDQTTHHYGSSIYVFGF